jgi:hypothetical protein
MAHQTNFEIPKTSFLESKEFSGNKSRLTGKNIEIILGARLWEFKMIESPHGL